MPQTWFICQMNCLKRPIRNKEGTFLHIVSQNNENKWSEAAQTRIYLTHPVHLRGGLDPLVRSALIFPTLVLRSIIIAIQTSANMRDFTWKVKVGIAIFFKYDILTQLFYIPNVVPTAPQIIIGKLPKFFMQSSTGVEVSLLPSSPPTMRV